MTGFGNEPIMLTDADEFRQSCCCFHWITYCMKRTIRLYYFLMKNNAEYIFEGLSITIESKSGAWEGQQWCKVLICDIWKTFKAPKKKKIKKHMTTETPRTFPALNSGTEKHLSRAVCWTLYISFFIQICQQYWTSGNNEKIRKPSSETERKNPIYKTRLGIIWNQITIWIIHCLVWASLSHRHCPFLYPW